MRKKYTDEEYKIVQDPEDLPKTLKEIMDSEQNESADCESRRETIESFLKVACNYDNIKVIINDSIGEEERPSAVRTTYEDGLIKVEMLEKFLRTSLHTQYTYMVNTSRNINRVLAEINLHNALMEVRNKLIINFGHECVEIADDLRDSEF